MKTISLLEILESRIAPAFSGTLNLGAFAAAHVDGHTANDQAGFSVAEAGDVNGDGNGDFIIGAPGANNGVGVAYVVFGKAGGQPATTDLDSIGSGTGFQINGQFANALLGRTVAAAGDVNGDGYDDVAVGAPLANINANNACGIAYVIFGGANPAAKVNASNLDGLNGFAVFGAAVGDLCGISVAGAGDVNGDGYADVVFGASGFDVPKQGGTFLTDAGGAVVLYGHAGAFNAFAGFDKIGNGSNISGVRLSGEAAGDSAGIAVSGAGDFNGDGLDDLVIGATGAGAGGSAYVVYGSKNQAVKGSVAGDLKITGIALGDGLGAAVARAGDVNGDGFSDIIIGASGNDATGNNSGESDVIFGGPNRTGSISALAADIRLQGAGANTLAGTSVHAAGDFNGDGFADLIIGATHANVGPGEAYVVFGKSGSFSAPVNLSALNGTAGFKIVGSATGDAGAFSVSGAGDLNHDGFDDLLFAAPGHTVGGKTDAGTTSIIYGSNGGNQVSLSADGRTATYTDVDGDLVTIKVSKGVLAKDDFHLSGQNALGGSTLQMLDLSSHTDLNLANLTITAKAQKLNGTLQGDGHANVGDLFAPNISLGAVKVGGDLGRLSAGSGGFLVPAVKTLSVYSLGQARAVTQSPVARNDFSFVAGSIGVLNVATNVENIHFLAGKIGVTKIGGDVHDSTFVITGDSAAQTVAAAVALKSFNVRGDFDHSAIRGGSFLSGNPDVQLGKIIIGGDFLASSLTAGITAGNDGLLATADDALYSGGSAAIVSRIASVVIKGQATGTVEAGGRFAIEAESIGSVQVGATKLVLSKLAKDHQLPLGGTGDLFVHEV